METIPNCEKTFFEGGPFFHVYTSGLENDLLFCSPEEMDEGLNMIALAVYACMPAYGDDASLFVPCL